MIRFFSSKHVEDDPNSRKNIFIFGESIFLDAFNHSTDQLPNKRWTIWRFRSMNRRQKGARKVIERQIFSKPSETICQTTKKLQIFYLKNDSLHQTNNMKDWNLHEVRGKKRRWSHADGNWFLLLFVEWEMDTNGTAIVCKRNEKAVL